VGDRPCRTAPDGMAVPRVGITAVVMRLVAAAGRVSADPASVVMVRRARAPAAGLWALPGGRLEFGESAVRAAARELLEETGMTMMVPRAHVTAGNPFVAVTEFVGESTHFVLLHVAGLVQADAQPTACDDADAAAWVPTSQLLEHGCGDRAVVPNTGVVVRRAVEWWRPLQLQPSVRGVHSECAARSSGVTGVRVHVRMCLCVRLLLTGLGAWKRLGSSVRRWRGYCICMTSLHIATTTALQLNVSRGANAQHGSVLTGGSSPSPRRSRSPLASCPASQCAATQFGCCCRRHRRHRRRRRRCDTAPRIENEHVQ
jgi:8-oxo-dGTP diphosphatase